MRLTLIMIVGTVLTACGGGGSSGNSVVPLAPQATLTLDSPSVGLTTGISNGTPQPQLVLLTITNPPQVALPYKITVSGAAVSSATVTWDSASSGNLAIQLPDPASLGKGTFTGIVHLMVCNDVGCTQSIKGSPMDVRVTYEVSDDATFSFNQPSWRYQATTADTFAQTVGFSLYLQNISSTGLFIRPHQGSGGFLTNETYHTDDDSSGGVTLYIDLTVASPSSVGSGYFKQNLTIEICYDADCTRQLVGSPITQPLSYYVFMTPGKEYTLVNADLAGTTDVAYDSASQKLVVTALNNYDTSNTGAVAQIDPASGAVGTQRLLSEDLVRIALSDDGQYAYAASSSVPTIHRLLLPTLASDLDIPLGSFGDPTTGGGANIAGDMAVAPGAAHTLAVSLAHNASAVQSAGTVIFDDAVPRTQTFEPVGLSQPADSLAWGDSASSLYALRSSPQAPMLQEIDALSVDTSGLSVGSSYAVDADADTAGKIAYSAGRIYDLAGIIRDAATGGVVGSFDIPAKEQVIAMVPDPSHGRIFYTTHYGWEPNLHVLIYDTTTLKMLSAADLGFDAYDGERVTTHMTTWGPGGVAFNRHGVAILSGALVAPPQTPTAIRAKVAVGFNAIRVQAAAR